MAEGLEGVPQRVETMADAVAAMDALERRLSPGDGVAAFNRMYLEVTRLVAEQVGSGFFAAPQILARLDVVFANRYLGALAAAASRARVPACWRILLERRHDPDVYPLQFALAGMNAHINHDLVLALVDVFTESRRTPHDAALHGDFSRVNGLLARIEDRVRTSLMQEVPARIEQEFGAAEDCVARWSIATARAVAWHDAAALWDVQTHPHLARTVTGALDAAVAAAAGCLLLPLAHHRGGRGSCRCPKQAPYVAPGRTAGPVGTAAAADAAQLVMDA